MLWTSALRVLDPVRQFFQAYEADETDARRFRARQLEAVLRLTPLAMAINLLNAIVLDMALWEQAPRGLLVAWTVAIVVVAALGVKGWLSAKRRPERTSASRRAIRRAAMQATMLGATWGILPAVAFSHLDAPAQFYLGQVVTGMICAGGFALAAVPSAATGFVLTSGMGAVIALFTSGLAQASGFVVLLFAYCGIVIYSVWTFAKTFGARMVAEACAERQNEVIELLLKDFEDHASDLLWELDAEGRFVRVSPRLEQALGIPAARLSMLKATAILRRWRDDDDTSLDQWAALESQIALQRAFRDVHVSLRTLAGDSWWSLSARPLLDDRGMVVGWRGVATDITDKHVAHRQLSWLANNDSLTGLVNRHQFRELLHGLLHGASTVSPFAIICFDLDGFKQINDSRGHAAGDVLLSTFGQRLMRMARRTDTVARLGGDEFAMVLRGVSTAHEVRGLLDRLLDELSEPCDVYGQAELLRVSIGVAMAPTDGRDYDTLLNHADLAMYDAKQNGGNRYCFFHAALGDNNRRRSALAQALRGAIERGEFRLEYQPQVSTVDEKLCGFEALLRWRHDEYGEVSPSEFVPIAESIGLMRELGDWVLERACEDAAEWPIPLTVSINVSATQLTSPGFVGRVDAAAAKLDPGMVELEVTESALIDDADAAVSALKQLRALGFRTALDDFGTGYSALGYLRRFPFDTLKIDRSFVRDLSRDGEAQVLVETILAMARALRMRTIAEGVEHVIEAEMLTQRGCAALQGYLVSRPIAPELVADFVTMWSGIPGSRVRETALVD